MKKTKIMQSLAEHFGNRINVKILVSDSSDNTNKQFSQNNLPEQENYSNNSFVATKNNETISNTSNSNNLRIEINQNLNPIEKLIIENFNVRDITR